jgi:AmiR/NasT family two-component response regulator
MKGRGIGEDEAFAALRKHAMAKGLKLGDAARQLVEIANLLG